MIKNIKTFHDLQPDATCPSGIRARRASYVGEGVCAVIPEKKRPKVHGGSAAFKDLNTISDALKGALVILGQGLSSTHPWKQKLGTVVGMGLTCANRIIDKDDALKQMLISNAVVEALQKFTYEDERYARAREFLKEKRKEYETARLEAAAKEVPARRVVAQDRGALPKRSTTNKAHALARNLGKLEVPRPRGGGVHSSVHFTR